MRVLSLHAPAACRLAAGRRSSARRSQKRVLVTRAQQGSGAEEGAPAQAPPELSAAAEQQAAPAVAVQAVADTAGQVQEEELAAQAVSDASQGNAASPAQQQSAVAAQVAPSAPTSAAAASSLPFGLSLEHPGVRIAGISAGVFLGGTLLLTLFRMGRDPQRKRSKTINKNKAVVDTISKYLPGNRASMSAASFAILKVQTGFTSAELFRKYLWFFLRERQFDEDAVGDLVALKAALGLDDAAVAGALAERARRIYEQYGTVMVNLEGMSQAGIERKAASRNLFIKLLSLTESRQLLSAEAATEVDLCKIFGVTPRDVLTLRSGYSAEEEGGGGGAGGQDGGDEEWAS